jgi:hypothetical protein
VAGGPGLRAGVMWQEPHRSRQSAEAVRGALTTPPVQGEVGRLRMLANVISMGGVHT